MVFDANLAWNTFIKNRCSKFLPTQVLMCVCACALVLTTIELVDAETLTVGSDGQYQDFQLALDLAQPGDTIELSAGQTFTGPFTLPFKSSDSSAFITIRTSSADESLPRAGERITPDYESLLPKIVSPGFGQPAVLTEARAHHYRFIAVEIAPSDSNAFVYDLIQLGSDNQNTLEEVPHHIVFDRCYIHAFPDQNLKRGIALNSAHTEILNSYVSGFKEVGQDSQAVCGWNGPGPFAIINNYLEAAGENVMFGGATASIPNLVPSDIEIRRNHFFKPLEWKSPQPDGTQWSVKNLLELKNARQVVLEDNLMENCWGAHSGTALVLTVRGEDGTMPWATIEDVIIRNNLVRHVGNGIYLLGRDDGGRASQQMNRITIENNIFDDIHWQQWEGAGVFIKTTDVNSLTINHNTIIHSGNITLAYGAPTTNFVFTNNSVNKNQYGVVGDDRAEGVVTLRSYYPGYVFEKNTIYGVTAVVGSTEQPCFSPDEQGCYPADNYYPPDNTDTDSYGTDGKAVGADDAAVNAAAASALSGVWEVPQ